LVVTATLEKPAINLMKKLNDSLLETRKDQLKRRSFLRNAPVATAFVLATVATTPAATPPLPGAPIGGGDTPPD
jgi:hypothetical protein